MEVSRGDLAPRPDQGGDRQRRTRHPRMGRNGRPQRQCPGPPRAPQGHGRVRHRPGDDLPLHLRLPAAGGERRGRPPVRPGLQRLGVRLLRRRPEADVPRGGAAPAGRGPGHRRVAARGQARLQVRAGAPHHRPQPLPHLPGVRSLVEGVRGTRHGAGHAHLPVPGRGHVAGPGGAHGRRPQAPLRRRGHPRLLTRPVRRQHHAGHGLEAGRRRRLRLHRRSHDLDRRGADDRLAGEIPAPQGGDSGVQLELAAAGAGEGRRLPGALPPHQREHRRPQGGLLQELLHRLRRRRGDHLPALGPVRGHRPVVLRHAPPRRRRRLGSHRQHEQAQRP